MAVGYAAAAALAAVAATPAVPAGLLPADRILEASRASGQVGPFLLAVPTATPAPPGASSGEQPSAEEEQALVGARPPQGPDDTATVRALGLSFSQARALGAHPLIFTAYRQAARTARRVDPSCGITWPLLAAIGHVESHHARSSVILGNGDTRPSILGPQLDGSSDFAAIADTDGGSLDGDSTWDRAVGPMQFIPSTWENSGRDGNRDGVRNPNNIFDATLAAAGYLCAGDRDLSLMSDRAEAVFSYNHSWDYVTSVLSLADAYASGRTVLVPSVEVRVPPAGEPAAGSAGTGRSSNGGSDRSGENSGDRPRPRDPEPTPTRSSARPTRTPTEEPTRSTTATPTRTASPTRTPTASPTASPTRTPTESPTGSPTASPTRTPTESPTGSPTASPTGTPTESPTATPTVTPTKSPTGSPTGS
ncbi:MAG: lytic murein transglycosylase, partial [Acidothermales bacterium]|nr:lytic murein transglycosylase [Acidothermales bacterium]